MASSASTQHGGVPGAHTLGLVAGEAGEAHPVRTADCSGSRDAHRMCLVVGTSTPAGGTGEAAPALMPHEIVWPGWHLADLLPLFPACQMPGLTPAVPLPCPQMWGGDDEHPGQGRKWVESTTKVRPGNKPVS